MGEGDKCGVVIDPLNSPTHLISSDAPNLPNQPASQPKLKPKTTHPAVADLPPSLTLSLKVTHSLEP